MNQLINIVFVSHTIPNPTVHHVAQLLQSRELQPAAPSPGGKLPSSLLGGATKE
jgi:hypothetical protein